MQTYEINLWLDKKIIEKAFKFAEKSDFSWRPGESRYSTEPRVRGDYSHTPSSNCKISLSLIYKEPNLPGGFTAVSVVTKLLFL